MNSETFRFILGRFSCISILDCKFRYNPQLFFSNVSQEVIEPRLAKYDANLQEVEMAYTCLFIKADQNCVLIDTGMGSSGFVPVTANLVKNLRKEGIEPDEIDTVILSHGHPDHIGGVVDHEGRLVFANARYVMHTKEWDYWMSNPVLEELHLPEEFKTSILQTAQKMLSAIADRLKLVDEHNAEILPGIRAIASFGHTPGHMSVEISSEHQHLLFIGDATIHPLHIEYPELLAMVDHQPQQVLRARLELLESAEQKKVLVFAPHFPFPGLGYVAKKENRWVWQPYSAS
jgi:glyoxylase-like metal-dependent hydrolase (beta-lactamase superfamily II)